MLINLDLQDVLSKFENEMANTTKEYPIADSCTEFALFDKDDDNIYCLQFNREEKTYSITMCEFEPNGGDFIEEVYLVTYPMRLYNREFLISKLVECMSEIISTSEIVG